MINRIYELTEQKCELQHQLMGTEHKLLDYKAYAVFSTVLNIILFGMILWSVFYE